MRNFFIFYRFWYLRPPNDSRAISSTKVELKVCYLFLCRKQMILPYIFTSFLHSWHFKALIIFILGLVHLFLKSFLQLVEMTEKTSRILYVSLQCVLSDSLNLHWVSVAHRVFLNPSEAVKRKNIWLLPSLLKSFLPNSRPTLCDTPSHRYKSHC